MRCVNAMINAATDPGHLRLMTDADLKSVLNLRNHAAIRRFMLTQHEISIEEHTSWFEHASKNPRTELLVFELNKTCCGFVQFKRTNYEGVSDWGFYVSPDEARGTGRKLGVAALTHAFSRANLHKICGQALNWNQSSIEFHKSLGFTQEGILRSQHFDGIAYHDLLCFGILRNEWAAKQSQTGLKNDHNQ